MSWFDKYLNGLQGNSGVSKVDAANSKKQAKTQSSNAQNSTIYDNVSYNQGGNNIEACENAFLEASANLTKLTPSNNINNSNFSNQSINSVSLNNNSSSVTSANITGNESMSQLRSSKSDAQSQLNDAKAQKTNNDAVNQAKEQLETDKTAYDEALEQQSEFDEQLQTQIDDIESKKTDNESAISEQQSQISDINSNIDSKNAQISDLNSQLSGLVQPSQGDYMTVDEEGKSILDSAAYSAAMAQYQAQKAALEQQISSAENELTDLESQLSDAQSQLSTLEQQSSEIDQELSDLLSTQTQEQTQNQQAVQEALNTYNDSQQNLMQTQQEQSVQLDSDIAQLESNITAYDNAIKEKEQLESQQASTNQQTNNDDSDSMADPLTIKAGDEEFTLLDSGVTQDTFDSVDDFLADKDLDEALEDIPGNKDNVLSFQELEDAGINVIDSDGNIMGIGQIRSKIATHLGIDDSAVSHIGIDINQDMIDNYNNGLNQDLTLVDISQKDENGNYKEVTGIQASSTFEDENLLREKYNLPESEVISDVQDAKSIASELSSELTEETENILNNAKILLNPDDYSSDQVKEAAESIEEASNRLNDKSDDISSDSNKSKDQNEEFGSASDSQKTATEESLVKLTTALKNLKSDDSSSKDEAKSLMLDAIKTYNIENGVAPEVANAIAMAYAEIGVAEEYVAGSVSGGMEYPQLDANGNTIPLSKEEGGIQANTGDMEKYGGRKGDAWCMKFLSWLYGDGQNINFSDKFSYSYSDISVSAIRSEAVDKGVYSAISHGDDAQNNYQPVPGDIMVLENNGASHVAMVINNDDDYVYTIEGNADNEVRAKKYLKSGDKYKDVSGYIRMNDVYGSNATPLNIDYLADDLDDSLAHSDTASIEDKQAFLLAKTHEGTI